MPATEVEAGEYIKSTFHLRQAYGGQVVDWGVSEGRLYAFISLGFNRRQKGAWEMRAL